MIAEETDCTERHRGYQGRKQSVLEQVLSVFEPQQPMQ
jgi:hypothetical protein